LFTLFYLKVLNFVYCSFYEYYFNYKYQNFKIFTFYHFSFDLGFIYASQKIQYIKKIDEISRVYEPLAVTGVNNSLQYQGFGKLLVVATVDSNRSFRNHKKIFVIPRVNKNRQ